MAITKSAKKAWRQSLKRRKRNLFYKEKIKNLIKEMRNLISQKKVKEDKSSFPTSLSRGKSSAIEEAKKLLSRVYKFLDKAAKVGVIKKNTAARKKSRIAKAILKSR